MVSFSFKNKKIVTNFLEYDLKYNRFLYKGKCILKINHENHYYNIICNDKKGYFFITKKQMKLIGKIQFIDKRYELYSNNLNISNEKIYFNKPLFIKDHNKNISLYVKKSTFFLKKRIFILENYIIIFYVKKKWFSNMHLKGDKGIIFFDKKIYALENIKLRKNKNFFIYSDYMNMNNKFIKIFSPIISLNNKIKGKCNVIEYDYKNINFIGNIYFNNKNWSFFGDRINLFLKKEKINIMKMKKNIFYQKNKNHKNYEKKIDDIVIFFDDNEKLEKVFLNGKKILLDQKFYQNFYYFPSIFNFKK